MKNIVIIIFIVLFSFILLNSIYVRATCNRLIEGMEQDDTDLDMKERFKKLEDKLNKIQEQIVEAEKTNEENARNIKQLKKN
jgi:predicted Holliday junction resolvase-like endonuclease